MTVRIAFDAGHGRYTPGKRCSAQFDRNETREWVLNDRDLRNTQNYLNNNYEGFEIIRLDDPTGNSDVDMLSRTNKANSYGCAILVSFHHNAGGGTGVIVIRQLNCNEPMTIKLQDNVYDELVKANGLKGNRYYPKPTQDLHMCRESVMPAVLIENGFMDHGTDVPLILSEDFSIKSGQGIAIGIAKTLGLKAKQYVQPEQKPVSAELYRVRKSWGDASSQIGAYQSLENAMNMCKAAPGYSVYKNNGGLVYTSPSQGIGYCTVAVLNVRNGAGTNYAIQGQLNLNEKVTIVGKAEGWRQVKYYNAPAKSYKTGWVSTTYLRITQDI